MSTPTRTNRRAPRFWPVLEALAVQVVVTTVIVGLLLVLFVEGYFVLMAAALPVAAWALLVAREHTFTADRGYMTRRLAATLRDRIVVRDRGQACPSDCGRPCSGCCYRAASLVMSGAGR